MMDTIQRLYARKSVRVFEDREITPAEKETILTAAVMAPSAGNQQLYTIIDVTDPALKAALADSCDHQPFIADAKMVLVFCADCKKWYEAYLDAGCESRKPGAGDLLLAISDANIAAQNAVVAADALGIGSCYIGDIMENCQTQRKLLGLPEYVFPAAMLVFGYPTQQQRERRKPTRPALSYIVRENAYSVTPEETRQALSEKEKMPDYNVWITNFCNRKYNSDFSREMTRSVEEYLAQYK